jgi:polysaccharide export outer membrane protein
MKTGRYKIDLSSPRAKNGRLAALGGFMAATVMACACVLLNGCATDYDAFAPMPMSPADISVLAGQPGYGTNYIQEGDVVSINFQYSTNFSTTQMVGLDGSLNLQVAGQIKAAGKTPLELQSELVALYKSQVKDDPITVKVVSPAAAIYVMGAVIHPGRIPMLRPMTVIEGIMEADGFDPSRAKLSEVKVLRVENGRQQVYRINLQRVFDGKNDEVFYLKPFDVVQVPAKVFNY